MRRPNVLRVIRSLLWLGAIAACVCLVRLGITSGLTRLAQLKESPSSPAPLYYWLNATDSVTTGFSDQLVKIVHQSWVDRKLPKLFARWSESFPRCFPDFQYKLWTDEDNRKLIASHYPWFLPRYDAYGAGVQRADVSRLFYMHHFGGLYCDLDCECLANFQHLLANVSLAFGAMSGSLIHAPSHPAYVPEGQIENSFMYSRPRHPFFWDLILRLNATTEGMAIMSSGPYLIMNGIHAARKLGLDRIRVDNRPFLTIYPPHYFNPFSWINYTSRHCRLFGKFTDKQLRDCRDSFPGSFVVQYHTQVWDKGKSIDARQEGVKAALQ